MTRTESSSRHLVGRGNGAIIEVLGGDQFQFH
jgi:hypothetical protein